MAKYTLDSLPDIKGRFKIITLDLDDTLLTSDKKISERNVKALMKAGKRGLCVCIATGRHPLTACRYLTELNCLNDSAYAIAFNGAVVVKARDYLEKNDPVDFPAVIRHTSAGAVNRQMIEYAHAFGCVVLGYSKTRGLLIEAHDPISERAARINAVTPTLVDFSTLSDDEEFYKFLALGSPEKLDAMRPHVPEEVMSHFSVLRSNRNFLEFVTCRRDKGKGLADLCQLLNIDIKESISFGDAENDLAILKAAGFSVGMANSQKLVLDEVDLVTASNNEDGVALVVEKML